MLLMLAAAAQKTGDVSYLTPYWTVMKTWADFLVGSLPDPGDELCTDDFEGPSPHNANLAVKGILGLAAYSYLVNMTGDTKSANYYLNISKTYASDWLSLANDTDHYRLQYDLVRCIY